MDEEAGEQSNARRVKEEAERFKQNQQRRQSISAVKTRTDDDIDDEEAGRVRKVLAKQSNARRASEVAELKRAAAEQRLSTHNGPRHGTRHFGRGQQSPAV